MRFFLFLSILLMSFSTLYSSNVKGTVKDSEGKVLIGATVLFKNLSNDVIKADRTNADGEFRIKDLADAKYELRVRYIGYSDHIEEIEIDSDKSFDIILESSEVQSPAVEVVANKAKFRETPIAFSTITKEEVDFKLGGDDLPMIMNETPSVFATRNGTGYGDSRINLRGFKQQNLSVMINGVPVNDMENGYVYWSNWDGIGNVASRNEIQRGLGSGKVANPSVGGLLNIVTDAAQRRAGITLKQKYAITEFAGAYSESRLIANTGKVGDFALTLSLSRKIAEGPIESTWMDAYGYYAGLSYSPSKRHHFDLFVFGAPQSHGRKSFRQNIAVHSHELAREAGVSEEQLNPNSFDYVPEQGRVYNPNWGSIAGLDGFKKTFNWNGNEVDFHYDDKINRNTNYYHKPHANLNWHWIIDNKSTLTNVFYMSTGTGGGGGTSGPPINPDNFTQQMNIAAEYEYNTSANSIDDDFDPTLNRSRNILTSNVNNHFWTGWLSTYNNLVSDNFTFQGGLDVRYYQGEHFSQVAHLLGGDYFVETILSYDDSGFYDYYDSTSNLNLASDQQSWMRREGDKIGYHYDTDILWYGAFFQGEYRTDKLSSYINTSVFANNYQRIDYFRTEDSPNGSETDTKAFLGYTLKGGANYNITRRFNIFGNVGIYNRPPFINSVFRDDNGVFDKTNNENVLGLELGSSYNSRVLTMNLNLYRTAWSNRTITRRNYNIREEGFNAQATFIGVDAVHQGIELDFKFRPIREMTLKGAMSFGDWRYTSDGDGYFYSTGTLVDQRKVYLNDLRVGDAPQTRIMLGADVYPFRGFKAALTYFYNMRYYADINPANLIDPEIDKDKIWQVPDYGTLDFFVQYRFRDISLAGNYFNIVANMSVKNVLDEVYISDANFREFFMDYDNPDDVEVHLGWPRQYTFQLILEF